MLHTILSNNSEPNAGGLEIAIRFTKTDDFLRIQKAAKDIGWVRACDLELVTRMKPQANSELTENYSEPHVQTGGNAVRCLFEIERAVHLASVFDEKLNKHSAPNAFITFSISVHNPSEMAQTNICERQTSPTWNYQLVVNVDAEYFVEEGKNFLFKVWHKSETSNKLLGFASVDLKPLICGLTSISGWYNIQDSVGNCQGQLKLNILPQESLFALKQLNESRKKTQTSKSNANFNSTLSRFSCFSATVNSQMSPNSNGIVDAFSTASTLSLTESSTSNLITSTSSLMNPCNSIEQIMRQKETKSDLKLGLMKKLNELDELNRHLRERLERKSAKKSELVFFLFF